MSHRAAMITVSLALRQTSAVRLPPARHLGSLRERGHPFSLLDFSTSIHKKSFVVRILYNLI